MPKQKFHSETGSRVLHLKKLFSTRFPNATSAISFLSRKKVQVIKSIFINNQTKETKDTTSEYNSTSQLKRRI